MFLGQNEYRSLKDLLTQLRLWPPLAKRLRQAPGYLWHRSYFQFPLRIGLVVAFTSRESLMEFAKTDEHRAIMHWLVGTDQHSGSQPADPDATPVLGGFIRILQAEEVGYANGTWSAESQNLQVLDHWDKQSRQESPPPQITHRQRRSITGRSQLRALGQAAGESGSALLRRLRHR